MAQEMPLSGSPAAAVSESVRRYRQMTNVEEEEKKLLEASAAATSQAPSSLPSLPLPSTQVRSPRENYLPDYLYLHVIREGSILQRELWKDTAVCAIANAYGMTAYATSGVLEKEYANADDIMLVD